MGVKLLEIRAKKGEPGFVGLEGFVWGSRAMEHFKDYDKVTNFLKS
jgi:hypothetical protein